MVRKGFTVEVTVEQKPKGGKEGHDVLRAGRGTANAKAARQQAV